MLEFGVIFTKNEELKIVASRPREIFKLLKTKNFGYFNFGLFGNLSAISPKWPVFS